MLKRLLDKNSCIIFVLYWHKYWNMPHCELDEKQKEVKSS